MALIKCPECQKEISEQAKACPHCGYPINSSKSEKKEEVKHEQQPVQQTINQNSTNTKEKKPKSNIMAGIMILLFIPLGYLGALISFIGIIWAIIELADKDIKKKTGAVVALIIFIIVFFLGLGTAGIRSGIHTISEVNNYIASSNTTSTVETDTQTKSETPKNTKKVTKENYDLIHEGMTEEEVFNILGEPESTSESETPGLGTMRLKHYQEGFSFVAIDVYFLEGKVYMKYWTEL